ncbi:hypothetical protein RSOLAG22IIIB_03249 [Rhizoctonia solani]|uniref:Uncharacterized protein n=1 Tax=Rhizoctonia solani TaxID=456999 RepID=A0A0K6FNH0_9AGAM|nr:hypothetical protein RSOLAG22IIIB_03249 [Rhizoctonia solani]
MANYATYETEVGLSRLRQKQLRAAEQPGESDISISRADRSIEGVAHLNSDKPLVQTKSKRLDLRTNSGKIDIEVIMEGHERLGLEAIGEKREANVSVKITRISQASRFDLVIQTPGDIDIGLPLDFTGLFTYEHAKPAYLSERAQIILGPDAEHVEYLPDGSTRRKLGNLARVAGELVGDTVLVRCEHEDSHVRIMMWNEEIGTRPFSLSSISRKIRRAPKEEVSFRKRDPSVSRLGLFPSLTSDYR